MIKQVIFTSVSEIKSGMTRGRKWTIYKYTDSDGWEFSTFSNTFPLNEPISVDYTEEEVPSRDGKRIFINRKLVEPPQATKEVSKPVETKESVGGELLIEVKLIRKLLEDKLK